MGAVERNRSSGKSAALTRAFESGVPPVDIVFGAGSLECDEAGEDDFSEGPGVARNVMRRLCTIGEVEAAANTTC